MLAAGEKDPEMPSPTGQTLKQPLSGQPQQQQQQQPVYNAPPQQYQQQPQYNAPSQQPQYSSQQPQATITTTTPATATAQPQQGGAKTGGGGGGGNGSGAPARRPSAMDLLPTFNYVTLIDWHRLNVLVMFFAFIVFVDACLIQPRGSLENYQIGVGAASFGIAFITFLISIPTKFDNDIVKIVLTTFQFLWWIQGCIVLTFFGSYQTTLRANGYFGSWFAFFFSALMFVSIFPFFDYHMDKDKHSPRKSLLFLMASSGVVMGAGIGPCSPQSDCFGYNAWSICLGSVSLFFGLVMFLLSARLSATSMAFIARFLILWWAVGTLVVTFGGPFKTSGNGFFFSYAALIASIAVLQSVV